MLGLAIFIASDFMSICIIPRSAHKDICSTSIDLSSVLTLQAKNTLVTENAIRGNDIVNMGLSMIILPPPRTLIGQ